MNYEIVPGRFKKVNPCRNAWLVEQQLTELTVKCEANKKIIERMLFCPGD